MRKVFGIKIKKFADTLLFLIVQLTFGPNSTDCQSKLPCNTSNSQNISRSYVSTSVLVRIFAYFVLRFT